MKLPKIRIFGWIGQIVEDEPIKFPKRLVCDNCGEKTTELYPFNNVVLCKKCLETMKKRFPSVKA